MNRKNLLEDFYILFFIYYIIKQIIVISLYNASN